MNAIVIACRAIRGLLARDIVRARGNAARDHAPQSGAAFQALTGAHNYGVTCSWERYFWIASECAEMARRRRRCST
eukprot:511482-Pyramimonas_sp.AAC.1